MDISAHGNASLSSAGSRHLPPGSCCINLLPSPCLGSAHCSAGRLASWLRLHHVKKATCDTFIISGPWHAPLTAARPCCVLLTGPDSMVQRFIQPGTPVSIRFHTHQLPFRLPDILGCSLETPPRYQRTVLHKHARRSGTSLAMLWAMDPPR